MFGDSGCCGFQLKKGEPTLLGAVTLSFPIIILGSILTVILTPFCMMSRNISKIRKQILLILQANVRLINNVSLCSKLRCMLAGKIFRHSPKLSGIIYKNFNSVILITIFLLGILVFFLIAFFLS